MLTIGLINLWMPLESIIEASKNKIDIIGASCGFPGLENQIDPKIPKIIGTRKKFKNLFLKVFKNKKQIKIRSR